jgi:5-methylcytosine-specific restriction protein A
MPTDWKRTRARIIDRDQGVCQLKLPGCTGKATSVDHVQPVSKGGTDDDANLVACCWPCNKRKGAREHGSLTPGG